MGTIFPTLIFLWLFLLIFPQSSYNLPKPLIEILSGYDIAELDKLYLYIIADRFNFYLRNSWYYIA